MVSKPLVWVGSTRDDVRAFPPAVRRLVGRELDLLQNGRTPMDSRSMPSIGAGVWELRVRAGGAFRVLYVGKFEESIYVLHAFQKKSRKTSRNDLSIGESRYREVVRQRGEG